VLWTAWGRDWRAEATPGSVVADVARGVVPGGTVLLHDSDCTSADASWRITVAALPLLAELFADHDLEVGPLRDHGLAPTARDTSIAW
jgi:peptidoglycan-N-acetylglucosamine deacetylase